MPQAAFGGDIAYDWEMWIGRAGGTEQAPTTDWTQIYGWTDLPWPDQVPEDIDVTHMQSPGRTRETMPGLLPVAEWSQQKQLWQDAGDDVLEALADLTRAGTRELVLIEFNLIPAGSSYRTTWQGYVNSFIPMGTVGGVAMVNVNLRLMQPQATNTRTIPT
jgi:hypothetical protein